MDTNLQMERIIKEKTSADHLMYVSLKYTKTCDVIVNLILRWTRMIETSMDILLESLLEKKKIKSIPDNPLQKIDILKKTFSKNKNMLEVFELFLMFRKINSLKTERIGEFRKNVTLKITFQGKEVLVNLEKLKQYAEILENFISEVKLFLSP